EASSQSAPGRGARFKFVQFEFAFPLGPADGRYLRRAGEDSAESSRVIVLTTLGAPPRRLLRSKRRRPQRAESGDPVPVPTVRATLVDAESLPSEDHGAAWLDRLRRKPEEL